MSFIVLSFKATAFWRGRWWCGQHFLNQGHIPHADFLCRGCMTAREMKTLFIMLQEERFKVGQRVPFAEQSPYTVFVEQITRLELCGFHFGKFLDQGLIYREVLFTVFSGRLVLMIADTVT